MAKAKKLPSGSWRCLVYSHTEKVLDKKTGLMKDKRVYESFTSNIPGPAGKRDAELQAARFASEKERAKVEKTDMTFGEALEAQRHSPKTVRNIHGLISAVLGQYRPDLRLTTALPKKTPRPLYSV